MNDYRDACELILMDYENESGEANLDDLGNNIPAEISHRTVYCAVQSITMNEFYSAATAGLKPEKKVIIHPDEYQGEQEVCHGQNRYSVLRTYQVDCERLELVLVRKVGDV